MISFKFRMSSAPAPRYACTQFYSKSKPSSSPRFTASQLRRHSAAAAVGRRAYIRNPVLAPSRVRGSNVARSKPKLSNEPQKAFFWNLRGYPFWHRPGCTWVHSNGDPRQTPRDNDCPACQEEVKRPTELSSRELAWQRQMQLLKEWIDRDPYDTVFGTSNDRLKGILRRGLLQERKVLREFGIGDPSKFEPFGKWRKSVATWRDQTDFTTENPPSEQTTRNIKSDEAAPKAEPKSPAESSMPRIQAYSRWKVSSTDAKGQVSEQSGELMYDPITMRMVPINRTEKSESQNEKSPSLTRSAPTANSKTENKEVTPAKNNQTPPPEVEAVQDPPDTISKVSSELNVSHQAQATSSAPKLATQDSSEEATKPKVHEPRRQSMDLTYPEKRLEMIHRAQKAMSMAQSKLQDLSVILSKSHNRTLRSAELSKSIKQTLKKTGDLEQGISSERPRSLDINKATEVSVGEELRSPTEEQPQKKSIPAVKLALEQSWAKENTDGTNNRKASPTSKTLQPAAIVGPSTEASEASKEPETSTPKIADKSPLNRDRALKHMTSHEIGLHRAALLRMWAKKHKTLPARSPADKKLDEEISAQKAAMAAFEGKWKKNNPPASIVAQSNETQPQTKATTPPKTSLGGDLPPQADKSSTAERWYKKSAAQALQREQEKLHDKALVATIKDIYEETYGKIDENHRQRKVTRREDDKIISKERTPQPMEEKNKPSVKSVEKESIEKSAKKQKLDILNEKKPMYQVLAYDRRTHSVHQASASDSFAPPTGRNNLSFTDALERLHNPAKFLSHIPRLHAEGYQIVSANKSLLVFKKIETKSLLETARASVATPNSSINGSNPEQSTPQQTPTPAAPSTDPPRPSSVPSSQNPRVRKEEAVFTGKPLKEFSSKNGRDYYSRRRRSRRMSKFLFHITGRIAFLVAGVYLIGCLIEEIQSVAKARDDTVASTENRATSLSPEESKSNVAQQEIVQHSPEVQSSPNHGFWNAVNREQTRRAEIRKQEAIQRAEEELPVPRPSERPLSAAHISAAAFDVAMFSTALWIVMKYLNWRS